MAGDRRTPSWLPWALCWVSLGLLAVGVVLRVAFPEGREDDGVFFALTSAVAFALVPLVGALIASRQPANPYGWLWCALGLAFGLQAVLEGVRRAGAAALNPARRRLQAAVDRRFDRARYDAARAVDAFAARLREQVDLDEVTAGLHETVRTTVAPSRVAVLIRDVSSARKA